MSEERKRIAAELLPHLAVIMTQSKASPDSLQAWLAVMQTLGISLETLIQEGKRQEGQQ